MLRKSLIALVVGLIAIPVVAQADRQFKKPYFMAQEPTITGTVESVTEHSFTVATEGGEHMTFHIDSRTLMPATLTPETRVWLEYALMDNGDHRAIRVSPLGHGDLAEQLPADRPRAEGELNDDLDEAAPVATVETEGDQTIGDDDTNGQMAADVSGDNDGTNGTNGTADDDENRELPSTASPWPIVQAVGALAVVSGAGLWFARRRRS